jgi:CRP-like cAMP-binding protein
MVRAGADSEVVRGYADSLRSRTYDAKQTLFVQNDHYCPLAFIVAGYVKVVHTDENGEETVRYLSGPGNFAACTQSFLFGARSHYTATTITECTVLLVDHHFQQKLLAKPEMRMAVQDIVIRRMDHLMEEKARMLPLRATERYLFFRERYPDVVKRVPAAVIANYIGVRPQSLSRIKQSLK